MKVAARRKSLKSATAGKRSVRKFSFLLAAYSIIHVRFSHIYLLMFAVCFGSSTTFRLAFTSLDKQETDVGP